MSNDKLPIPNRMTKHEGRWFLGDDGRQWPWLLVLVFFGIWVLLIGHGLLLDPMRLSPLGEPSVLRYIDADGLRRVGGQAHERYHRPPLQRDHVDCCDRLILATLWCWAATLAGASSQIEMRQPASQGSGAANELR